jgi:hypothetical protein
MNGSAVRAQHPSAPEQRLDDAAQHVGLFGGGGEGLDAEAEECGVIGRDRGGDGDQLRGDGEVAVDAWRAAGGRTLGSPGAAVGLDPSASTAAPLTVSRVSSTNTPIPPPTPTSTPSVM